MNEFSTYNFGVLDNRFLAKSVGFLNPRSPLTVRETDSLKKALLLLREHKIGAVLVVDANDKVTGIFTERDVLLKVVLEDFATDIPIAQVMSRKPRTIQMTTTMAFALQMMSEQGYRHLPIVDDEDYPVGIVSVKDIIDYIVHSLTHALNNV